MFAAARPSSDDNALTDAEYWAAEHWGAATLQETPDIRFDPTERSFAPLHRFLQRWLPVDPSWRFLEVGCCPGRFLWYFHETFGYSPTGIEYVAPACETTRRALAGAGVAAEVLHADLFTFQPSGPLWDVVGSFGVVEHFRDPAAAIRAHTQLVRPGGWLVIEIPNHAGLHGTLLKWSQPDIYERHNRMSYAKLLAGVERTPGLEVVAGGYLGGFHSAPSDIQPFLRTRDPWWVYRSARGLFRAAECLAPWLPETRWLSPCTVLIARRTSEAAAQPRAA